MVYQNTLSVCGEFDLRIKSVYTRHHVVLSLGLKEHHDFAQVPITVSSLSTERVYKEPRVLLPFVP